MNFQIERFRQFPQYPGERWQGALFRPPSRVKDLLDSIFSAQGQRE